MSLLIAIEAHRDFAKTHKMRERLNDLTPVWLARVQPIVTDFLTQRFASEGAYEGVRWAPLRPSTLRQRRKPGRGRGGIGRDTGRLWASFVKSAGSTAAPNGLLVIEPQRYERGSAVPYARFFHGGTRRQVPRPVWPDPLPESLVTEVAKAVRAYVAKGKL